MASPTVTAIFAAAESTAKAAAKAKKPPKHYYYTSRWFWASSCAVVAALMLLNVYKRLQAWRLVKKHAAEPVNTSPEVVSSKSPAKISQLPSAIHAQWSSIASYKTSICPDWLYALPSLNELLFLALYAACSIVFAIHGTWSDKLKKYDAANQMGHIAFAQVTFIIGLAGKNNVISFLTGISYQKLNVLHRASGRLCWIFSVVHSIGRIQKGMSSGKHSIYVSDMQWGVVALIFYTFLTFGSLRFLRNMAYEAFLIGHIVMVAGYLIAAWLHWPPFSYWIYPGIILWGLDRVARVINVIVLNKLWWVLPFGSKERRERMGECTVELVSPQVLRIKLSREGLKWSAGQHAYLVMPTVSTFPLEAHPFSIASAPSSEGPSEAVFIIKVHDGFTRRLRDKVSSTTTTHLPVYIDGPYGSGRSLDHFHSVVLVAGGTGITYALGHFLQVLNRAKSGRSGVRHLSLVWNVRQAEHLQWILPLLQDAFSTPVPSNLTVEISIYTTSLSASSSVSSLNEKEAESDPESSSSFTGRDPEKVGTPAVTTTLPVRWFSGRADLTSVVTELAKGTRAVAVNVCGPRSLATSTRQAVAHVNDPARVLRGQGEVVLYEETFGW